MMNRKRSRELFHEDMVHYMIIHFNVEGQLADRLVDKYIDGISTESRIVQHIGADYFAIQVLMAEGVIPYLPI